MKYFTLFVIIRGLLKLKAKAYSKQVFKPSSESSKCKTGRGGGTGFLADLSLKLLRICCWLWPLLPRFSEIKAYLKVNKSTSIKETSIKELASRERKNLLPLLGNKTQFLVHPACSPSLHQMSYTVIHPWTITP